MGLKAVASKGGGGSGGTVTQINTGTGLTGGPITTTGTISVAASTANTLAGYNNSGVFSDVTLGTGLSLSGGTLAVTNGGVTTIGTFDANGASPNGASISGSTLFMQSADGMHPGEVNNTAQTFSGTKTLENGIIIPFGSYISTNPGAGHISLDTYDRIAYDFSQQQAVDWGDRHLINQFGTTVVTWANGLELIDGSNVLSVDWANRGLVDSSSNTSVDYGNYFLYDTGETLSVAWDARIWYDIFGDISGNWNNRQLYAASTNLSYDWGARAFYGLSGSLLLIDHTGIYNSGAGLSFDASGNSYFSQLIIGETLTASELVATNASKQLVSITALPNGTTATTQASSDNTTKVATDAFVQAVVSAALATNPRVTSAITNATATMSNITDLTYTLQASTNYAGAIYVCAKNSVSAEGLKFDIAGGSGASSYTNVQFGFGGSASGAPSLGFGTLSSTTYNTPITVTKANTIDEYYTIYFSFTTSTGSPTFIPRFAEVSSVSGTATIEKGSFMHIWPTSN